MRLRLVAVTLLVAACPSPKTPIEPDAGSPDAAVDAGLDSGAAIDAGPVDASVAFEIHVRAESDAGVATELEFVASAAPVDAVQVLEVATSVELRDYRIRLYDWADQIVPSDDLAIVDGGITYRIGLLAPLRTGRTYSLVLDADLGASMLDPAGRPLDDVRLTLNVRGEVQVEPGTRLPKKKKK
jgi:hypothetical protein